MKLKKKGFTITELVIVIAVIGILAAVLIPVFTGVIGDANLTADQLAVKQMNTALSIKNKKASSIDQVYAILAEASLDGKGYKPLTAGYKFVWIGEENKIALINDENKVVFPEELKDTVLDDTDFVVLGSYSDPNRLFFTNIPKANSPIELDNKPDFVDNVTIYCFRPVDDGSDEYAEQREFFGAWIADFAIIINDEFEPNTVGICGQYLFLSWQSIEPDWKLNPGETYLLMDAFPGWTLTYEGLVELCNSEDDGFYCGAYNYLSENVGKSITVELRLYQPDENGEKTEKYVVCDERVYEFKDYNA